jgi:uncharacterized membrane protein YcaP (DUF421 family)
LIRWYDYIAAFVMADVMMTSFFSVPVLGAVIAFGLWELWKYYCEYRKGQEDVYR